LRSVHPLGEPSGSIRRYSDRLLEFLLRGARPEKYRARFILPVAELDKLIERELAIAKGETEPSTYWKSLLKAKVQSDQLDNMVRDLDYRVATE
jgi:hypothetical protein